MFNQRLPDFNPVSPGQIATLKIPKWALTMMQITMRFGGTSFTKALIDEIKLLIGSKTVWSLPTAAGLSAGTILDMYNKTKGIYDQANRLSINLWDPNQETGPLKEIGGWDLSKLPDEVYLQVKINAAAVAPTLYANGWFAAPQGATPEDPTGQLITKIAVFPFSFSGGGRFPIPFEPKGALIKDISMIYTGADGTATTNANISKFEVKRNGFTRWELDDQENRFYLQERKRVPQNKLYHVDLCADNNLSGALVTANAESLEFYPTLTAADNGVVLFNVLDAPYNLSN